MPALPRKGLRRRAIWTDAEKPEQPGLRLDSAQRKAVDGSPSSIATLVWRWRMLRSRPIRSVPPWVPKSRASAARTVRIA